METPAKRRKSRKAASTQQPHLYWLPSFLVNRMSLSEERIELGVPALLKRLVLTVLTEICKQTSWVNKVSSSYARHLSEI
jgi:hypothetical protein